MKDKKVFKQWIFPSIIIVLLAMPVLWGILDPVVDGLPDEWGNVVKYSLTLCITIGLMLIIWKQWLFSLKCPAFFQGLVTFGLLGLLGAVGAFVFSQDTCDVIPSISGVISLVLMNLAIAMSEEFLFRGVVLNSLLKAFESGKNPVRKAVLWCSVIFGLRHLLNLIETPAGVFATLAQVLFTFMAGTYLCAVYLRTRNLWVVMFIHFLEDFSTSVWTLFSTHAQASAVGDITIPAALGMVALQIPYVIFAWLMLKDPKWDQKELTIGKNRHILT